MKKFLFIFLFLPIIVVAQERIDLKNSILDSISFFPINNANIHNFDFKSYFFTIKGINLDFIEKKKDTITCVLPNTYREFKKEFLGIKFNSIYRKIEDASLTQEEIINAKFSQGGLLAFIPGDFGKAVMHPISYLYDKFSRKMKMERLYKELVDNQEEVYNLSQKYNKELVASLTGLEREELLDFMTFCKFSYYDLVRWTPEFIILQVKKRYGDYEYFKVMDDYY